MKRLQAAWYWLMEKIETISKFEPATIRGAAVALISALAVIGVKTSPDLPATIGTIVTAIVTVSALISALWTRRSVTANARVVVEAPDPVDHPRHVVPGEAVTRASDVAILDAARTTPTNADAP